MELAIQTFIKANGLQAAVDKWLLKVSEEGNLVMLNYNMIDSPKAIQEVDECRGLILDKTNWNVVVFPFYRFYNEGEGPAAKPDLATASLMEKLDGTLITLYWHPYNKEWTVSTRGRILADGGVNYTISKTFGTGEEKTFAKLFWDTVQTNYPAMYDKFKVKPYSEDVQKHRPYNLVFELFGPENRILTKYDKTDIRLLAGRRLNTLEEMDDSLLDAVAVELGVARPKKFAFNTKEDIIKIFDSFNPTEEGFVLTDYKNHNNGSFFRVKIKNPRYLALHHLLGAGEGELLTGKRIATLIRSGDASEVISYFPEYADKIREMEKKFAALAGELDAEFDRIKHLGLVRKDFAMEAKKFKLPAALFTLLDKKAANGQEFVMQMNEESLLALLKV